MKKIVCLLLAFIIVNSTSFGQKKDDKNGKGAPAKTEATSKGKEGHKAPKMKKDGTPDMRHKENKEAGKKKPAGPMKKDGTPDMRHKANKEAAKKK